MSWMNQRNFHSGAVSVYGSSIFETLTHTILLIVSETDPDQPRGKCKAKEVYLIRFPVEI